MLFNAIIRAEPYLLLHDLYLYKTQVLHGCLQIVTVSRQVNSANDRNPKYWLHSQYCLFDKDRLLGLRQVFMTLMGRATGVPHDIPQYVARSQDGANHEQYISTNSGL